MKEIFLWTLVAYMVLDFMAVAGQWIINRPIKVTGGVLILVAITHGFLAFGGLLVITGVWK